MPSPADSRDRQASGTYREARSRPEKLSSSRFARDRCSRGRSLHEAQYFSTDPAHMRSQVEARNPRGNYAARSDSQTAVSAKPARYRPEAVNKPNVVSYRRPLLIVSDGVARQES